MGAAIPGHQQQQHQQASAAGPWFRYYILRMSSRWQLRTLIKKYIPFLNIHSRLAMQPGASISALSAVEERLGTRLPWELWELYRFKGGQSPGQAVTFADSCRLLEPRELYITQLSPPSGPSLAQDSHHQEQQLAALQQQIPALINLGRRSQKPGDTEDRDPVQNDPNLLQRGMNGPRQNVTGVIGGADAVRYNEPSSPQQQQQQEEEEAAAAAAAGQAAPQSTTNNAAGEAAAAAVVFLSNVMGSSSYCASLDASVHIIRGFTQRRVAGSLAGFLQHLLT